MKKIGFDATSITKDHDGGKNQVSLNLLRGFEKNGVAGKFVVFRNRLCTRIFRCPALTWDRTKKKAVIDEVICAGCGVCYSICPQKAIIRTDIIIALEPVEVDRRAFEKEITQSLPANKRAINLTAFDAGMKMI